MSKAFVRSWLWKTKFMCDNLGAVHSSDVDGKQLYENIIDC